MTNRTLALEFLVWLLLFDLGILVLSTDIIVVRLDPLDEPTGFVSYEKSSTNQSLKQFIDYRSYANRDDYLAKYVPDYLRSNCLTNNKNDEQPGQLVDLNLVCYSNVHTLDLSLNKLAKFPHKLTNEWFNNLKHLNLSRNQLESLNSSVDFIDLNSKHMLESVDLSNNRLKSIEPDTFKYLSTLNNLNLSGNQISKIDLFAFTTDAQHLVHLDLSNNLINDQSVEFLLFASLSNLKYLNLNGNHITTLSHHLLYNLYSLEYLSLAHNKLRSFDLFRLDKNNELLRVIDLSFNRELKLDFEASKPKLGAADDFSNKVDANVDMKASKSSEHRLNSSIEHLDLAGVHLGTDFDMISFLDSLFGSFKLIKHLNLSSSGIDSFLTSKWPLELQVLDLSNNLLRDETFNCKQIYESLNESSQLSLKELRLSGNSLRSFKSFMADCIGLQNSNENGMILIDLRNNLFESLDNINSIDMKKTSACSQGDGSSSIALMMQSNPLVCDCDEHNWWQSVESSDSSRFQINREHCLTIVDFERLSCTSVSLQEENSTLIDSKEITVINGHVYRAFEKRPTTEKTIFKFDSIASHLIAPNLICPYKYSCSAKTCECCGFRACDCSFHCPSVCHCARDYANTFDVVNCTQVNLNFIPNYLPTSTTELLLNNNNLKRIQPYQFFGRFRLLRVDLSFNMLAFIEENSFHGLTNLKSLKLSFNNLQILLGYEFKDLNELESLYLDNNQIQFISNKTFSYLVNLKYLYLANNNLRHNLEPKFYFQFNLNLVNVSIEKFSNQIETVTKEETIDSGNKLIESIMDSEENSTTRKKIKSQIYEISKKLYRKFDMRGSSNGSAANKLDDEYLLLNDSFELEDPLVMHYKANKSLLLNADGTAMTYESLFRQLLSSRKTDTTRVNTSYMECLLNRFKETLGYQLNNLTGLYNESTTKLSFNNYGDESLSNSSFTISLNDTIKSPNHRLIIVKNIKKYKFICSRIVDNQTRQPGDSSSLDLTETKENELDDFKYGNNDLVPLKSQSRDSYLATDYETSFLSSLFADKRTKESKSPSESITGQLKKSSSSSFIMVDYKTIIWYTFLLVCAAILLSVIFVLFLNRYRKRKKLRDKFMGGKLKKKSFISRTKFGNENDEEEEEDEEERNRRQYSSESSQNTSNETISNHNSNSMTDLNAANAYGVNHLQNPYSHYHLTSFSGEEHASDEASSGFDEYTRLSGSSSSKKASPPTLPLPPKPASMLYGQVTSRQLRNSFSNNTLDLNGYGTLAKLLKYKEQQQLRQHMMTTRSDAKRKRVFLKNSSDINHNLNRMRNSQSCLAANNLMSSEAPKLDYDLFIVYNKLDSDLVSNVIAPILKDEPYFFKVALQHDLPQSDDGQSPMPPTHETRKATTTFTTDIVTTKITTTDSTSMVQKKNSMMNLTNNGHAFDGLLSSNESNSPSIKLISPMLSSSSNSLHRNRYCRLNSSGSSNNTATIHHKLSRKSPGSCSWNIENYLEYIKSSSLVIFVLSKNLFSETEYKLALQTPKSKKIAILADDICETIAEKILKPKKIIRGAFSCDTEDDSSEKQHHNYHHHHHQMHRHHRHGETDNNEYIELNEEEMESGSNSSTTTDDSTIDSGTATAVTLSSAETDMNSHYEFNNQTAKLLSSSSNATKTRCTSFSSANKSYTINSSSRQPNNIAAAATSTISDYNQLKTIKLFNNSLDL